MTTKAAAGWYPDPADPGARRFWDGDAWTHIVTAGADGDRPGPVEGGPLPAGWYPDPGDAASCRFWDGDAWTERVMPKGGATTDARPGAPDGASTASTASAIATLQASVDRSDDQPAEPPRPRRTVVLALLTLLLLVASGALVLRPDDAGAPAAAPAPSTTVAPPAAVPAPAGPRVAAAYEACQEVVKASPLSDGVRLVFQRVDDVARSQPGDRTMIEFWVRKKGDLDQDGRVSFVCLVDDAGAEPGLFMALRAG